MQQANRHVVGDIFRIYDEKLQSYRNVFLARFIQNGVQFYLVSMHSFEKWSEHTVADPNIYFKTTLTLDEVRFLAETSDVTFIGNIYEFRHEIDELMMERVAVAR